MLPEIRLRWLLVVTFATALCLTRIDPARAEDPSSSKWPAYVDGKFVPKTFRFKPSSIEYRALRTENPETLVVFGIKERNIPADYFLVTYRSLNHEEAKFIKDALAEDHGYITVVGTWVNPPTPKDEKGRNDYWVDGRVLLGELQRKQVDTKEKPKPDK